MSKAESYTPCVYCDTPTDCAWLGRDSEQACWGEVSISDELEPGSYIHACEGHCFMFCSGEYTPESEYIETKWGRRRVPQESL